MHQAGTTRLRGNRGAVDPQFAVDGRDEFLRQSPSMSATSCGRSAPVGLKISAPWNFISLPLRMISFSGSASHHSVHGASEPMFSRPMRLPCAVNIHA